jgi:hypothetical protein
MLSWQSSSTALDVAATVAMLALTAAITIGELGLSADS